MRTVLAAADFDLAAMQLHDALHERHPSLLPSIPRVGPAVQLFEDLGQFVAWDARPGIGDFGSRWLCRLPARTSTASTPEVNLSVLDQVVDPQRQQVAVAGSGPGTGKGSSRSSGSLPPLMSRQGPGPPTISCNNSGTSTGSSSGRSPKSDSLRRSDNNWIICPTARPALAATLALLVDLRLRTLTRAVRSGERV